MAETSKRIVIFSGKNQRAIFAFCRFAEQYKVPYTIICRGESDSINITSYKNKTRNMGETSSWKFEEILEKLIRLKKEENVNQLVVLPTIDELNIVLLENKRSFEANGIIVPLVDKDLYYMISSKKTFTDICGKHGFNVPLESSNFSELKKPFVIKPKHFLDIHKKEQFKPIIVKEEQDVDAITKDLNLSNCFFQEFIEGRSHYLLFYVSRNGKHVKYAQENLIQQDNGASMIAAVPSNIFKKKIADEYLKFLVEIGFAGLIMIELKEKYDRFYFIEANPRLWGPSQFFVDSNIPIFYNFVKELNVPIQPKNNDETILPAKYFWYGGVMENYQYQRTLTYYNYESKEFFLNLPEWLKHDVYRREDTMEIYIKQSLKFIKY